MMMKLVVGCKTCFMSGSEPQVSPRLTLFSLSWHFYCQVFTLKPLLSSLILLNSVSNLMCVIFFPHFRSVSGVDLKLYTKINK